MTDPDVLRMIAVTDEQQGESGYGYGEEVRTVLRRVAGEIERRHDTGEYTDYLVRGRGVTR